MQSIRRVTGQLVETKLEVDRNSIVISDIEIDEIDNYIVRDVLKEMCAISDREYVRLVLPTRLADRLSQESDIDIRAFGFESFGSHDQLHRIQKKLSNGCLVYVRESGPQIFEAFTMKPDGIFIGRFLGEHGKVFHSLHTTERALRCLREDFIRCNYNFRSKAHQYMEPVDLFQISERHFKGYGFLREEFLSEQLSCEASFSHLITMAGMLDDRIANLATSLCKLSGGKVWPAASAGSPYGAPSNVMKDRRSARESLYRAFPMLQAPAPLEKLQKLRNNLLHAEYYYAFVELERNEVIFSDTFDFKDIYPERVQFEFEVCDCLRIQLDHYLPWFLSESASQIKGFTCTI